MDEAIDIESQTDNEPSMAVAERPSFVTQSSAPQEPTERRQTLDVRKAQRIINGFTSDPSWLADPRTSSAANSIFAAAAKVVGMNAQLQRLRIDTEAASQKTSMRKQMVEWVSSIASVGDGRAGQFIDDQGNIIFNGQNYTNAGAIFSTLPKTQKNAPMDSTERARNHAKEAGQQLEAAKASGNKEKISEWQSEYDFWNNRAQVLSPNLDQKDRNSSIKAAQKSYDTAVADEKSAKAAWEKAEAKSGGKGKNNIYEPAYAGAQARTAELRRQLDAMKNPPLAPGDGVRLMPGQAAPAVREFTNDEEALKSGVKGEVVIGGRKARID